MPFSNWHVSYSINIDELDCQHKLFTIFDVLYGIFVYQNKVNSYTKIIEELVSYSDYHFRLEEKYMRYAKHKDIDKHIAEHNFIGRWPYIFYICVILRIITVSMILLYILDNGYSSI